MASNLYFVYFQHYTLEYFAYSELSKKGSAGENTASAVFTNNEENKNKPTIPIVKPPPFYVSLIIGNNLVHNCIIDSGATSLVMPKKVADQLGLKYQPLKMVWYNWMGHPSIQ